MMSPIFVLIFMAVIISDTIQIECLLYVAPLPLATNAHDLRARFPDTRDILIFKDESKGHKTGADAFKDPPG